MEKTYDQLKAENERMAIIVAQLMNERPTKPRVAHPLLDHILKAYGLRTDSQICKKAGIAPPHLSKVRARVNPVGPSIMVRLHEAFGISFKEMRQLLQGENVSV